MLRGLRNIKSLSILPVVFWLFTQLIMSGFLFTASASASDSNKILICGPNGIKYVSAASLGLDDGSYDTSEGDDLAASQDCEWCLSFGNLAPLSATLEGLRLPAASISKKTYQVTSEVLPLAPGIWLFHGRAPPLS